MQSSNKGTIAFILVVGFAIWAVSQVSRRYSGRVLEQELQRFQEVLKNAPAKKSK